MLNLSLRVDAASESQTLAIAARAKQMKAAGIDVVSLSTGEPDFSTPDCIKQAAIEAINNNHTHYTESNGILALRQKVAEKFRNENGICSANEQNVLISCGAKHSIMNTLTALCNPGDEVVIPSPYWVSYPAMATLAGATSVIVPTTKEMRFLLTPESLASALTPLTKCVIINSPSNPTGMMYSPEQLDDIADVLADHDCYIISDEIYEKIHYNSITHSSLGARERIAHRVITVNGCSKAYAMTGWRIGFMTGPVDVIRQAAKVQSQDTSNPTSIAQYAALAALTSAAPDVEVMRHVFAERRTLLIDLLNQIEGIETFLPDGAFYAWVGIDAVLPSYMTSALFCETLLEKEFCAVVPGDAFGMTGYIRLSFAASEQTIRSAVERIARCIKRISEYTYVQ